MSGCVRAYIISHFQEDTFPSEIAGPRVNAALVLLDVTKLPSRRLWTEAVSMLGNVWKRGVPVSLFPHHTVARFL